MMESQHLLWFLGVLGTVITVILGVVYKKADTAHNNANTTSLKHKYAEKDIKDQGERIKVVEVAVNKIPERMATLEGSVKSVGRTMQRIEGHLLKNQRSLVDISSEDEEFK